MIAHFGRKKISLIKQRDSMQCGIACLAMICQYYGRKINLDELEYQCGVTNQGVSMLGLKNTAESIGLMTYSASMEIEELRNINVASILHWDQNHFVVLYKIDKKNRYYIADPAKGLITVSESVLKKHWISDFDNCN